jgi:pimeloyl-ACP methyl ester carboxylesterase
MVRGPEAGDADMTEDPAGSANPGQTHVDLVVLEAGLGFSGLYWEPVQRVLSPHVRVVAYDRSGFGGSAVDPEPRSLERLAADLVDVVRAFPHRRLILVGHSWGGPIVRTAAQALRVDGLVLVDPTDEHADLYFEEGSEILQRLSAGLIPVLARLGLLGLALRAMGVDLTSAVRAGLAEAIGTSSAAAATVSELSDLQTDLRALLESGWGLEGVPVRLLSGALTGPGEGESRQVLIAAHRRTARANPGVTFVEATESSHLVPVTEPQLVAQQVRELLGS